VAPLAQIIARAGYDKTAMRKLDLECGGVLNVCKHGCFCWFRDIGCLAMTRGNEVSIFHDFTRPSLVDVDWEGLASLDSVGINRAKF
jgi:hypothetical protein